MKHLKSSRGFRSVGTDYLTEIANEIKSDKGNKFYDRHFYTRVYRDLFDPFKDKPIRLLEIGLRHPHGGRCSLDIWRRYFSRAEIVGMDIDPIRGAVQGDSGNREDLAKVGSAFDIIIDDASHASEHQQTALGYLSQCMKPGGVYCIEDLHWQPEWSNGETTKFVLNRFRVTGKMESRHMTQHEKFTLETHLDSVNFFDSLNPKRILEQNEALAVLRWKSIVP